MPNPMPTVGGSPASKVGVVGLITLIIGFVVGYGMGRVTVGSSAIPGIGKGGYNDGYSAAVKKMRDGGRLPPVVTETRLLSGTIKAIGNGSLTLTVDLSSLDPVGELNAPEERTITIVENTKIVKLMQMSPEQQQETFAAFREATQDMKPGDMPPAPPSNFIEEELSLTDLKAGDKVTVSAEANILKEASFTATAVSVSVAVVMPTTTITPPQATPPTP